jgi:hypothetical protein
MDDGTCGLLGSAPMQEGDKDERLLISLLKAVLVPAIIALVGFGVWFII